MTAEIMNGKKICFSRNVNSLMRLFNRANALLAKGRFIQAMNQLMFEP